MKLLSVRQPWASAIVNGEKDVENRTWSTRYRGPVAIHASLHLDTAAVFPDGKSPGAFLDLLPRGAVIGVVDLLDVVQDSPSPWAQPEAFHWLLGNARHFVLPIAWKGALGLVQLEDGEATRFAELAVTA